MTGLNIEDRRRLEDIGFMTCMTLVLLGNYAQTGHFGGPLAYTPFNVAAHLAGPEHGGMRYDYRRPKHPFGDKFMMAAGHSVPTCYALYMVLGQALERKFKLTGDKRYYCDPEVAILPVDALGFRRGAGALKTLLADRFKLRVHTETREIPLYALTLRRTDGKIGEKFFGVNGKKREAVRTYSLGAWSSPIDYLGIVSF